MRAYENSGCGKGSRASATREHKGSYLGCERARSCGGVPALRNGSFRHQDRAPRRGPAGPDVSRLLRGPERWTGSRAARPEGPPGPRFTGRPAGGDRSSFDGEPTRGVGKARPLLDRASRAFPAPVPGRHRRTTPPVKDVPGHDLTYQAGLYRARDGHVALATLEPHFWKRLLQELGVKGDRRDLEPIFVSKTAQQWEEWATARDLPLVAVREWGVGKSPIRRAGSVAHDCCSGFAWK